MCSVPAALGAVSGVATYSGQAAQARAQHAQQVAAARRANQINDLNYQNQLKIAIAKDKDKSDVFTRKMEAMAASQSALARQKALNQLEATRASVSAQTGLRQEITDLMFKSQTNLAKAIQARGTLLAGQQPGQSMLLSLQDIDRVLGQETAQLNAQLFDTKRARYAQQYGIDLDKYTADIAAIGRLPSTPVAQRAEFGPQRMPEVQGPTGASLQAGLLAAAGSGVSAGIGTTLQSANVGPEALRRVFGLS